MGNQTLVPSQIQSVESYFLDLKTYVQFKSSLGSTTFMKTAKVNLIEGNLDDLLMLESAYRNLSFIVDSINASSNPALNQIPSSSSNNSNLNAPNASNQANALNPNTLSTSPTHSLSSQQQALVNRFNHQFFKQQMQKLREQQQVVVVKIFPKYDLSIRLDLYSKRVKEIKNIIYSRYGPSTNCLPFADLVITDRAAFLFRQYIKYNLYDRLSTRPFLTLIEKKWIAYQLLSAVNEIHSLQIVHGDIKIENVLLNSFLWVILADFASYKPIYLSKNHPSADFNYYFDISRRRTCYLAPERLDSNSNRSSESPEHDAAPQNASLYELKPPDPNDFKASMDIFSLGCVLAELFNERPLFDFAKLLAYREKKFDPINELSNEIHDKNILDMILSMISLNPLDRKTINEYLVEQNDMAFPSYFVYLKSYLRGFINAKLTADEIAIKLKNEMPILLKNFKLNLDEEEKSNANNQNDAFFILLSLLLSCIRKIKFSDNKLIAIDLLSTFNKFLDDSVILDRCVPYYLWLLEQEKESPIVKSHVIYALNDCLSGIYKIDMNNLNIFTVMIFECLEKLSNDSSILVRSTLAKTIATFALTSLRYLDMSFLTCRTLALKNTETKTIEQSDPSLSFSDSSKDKLFSYDTEYEKYQLRITKIVMNLITDLNQNSGDTNAVKEALIRSDISKLCSFFSRQKTSEFLLPHMITILNEKTDWSIRAAFFDALCPVLTCIGWESVEIVKPLLEQGLRDSEEFVIYRTLLSLCKMIEMGLLDKQQICHFLSNHVVALLCHPSLWIRHGAVCFVASIYRSTSKRANNQSLKGCLNSGLNTVDVLCSVLPLLSKFLQKNKEMITNFDREEIFFQCLKKPIQRAVLDLISQDGRSEQLLAYLNQRAEIRYLNLFNNQNFLPSYIDCSDPGVQELFEKLCKCGFVEEDEDKLLQMKDFLEKTRISRLSSSLYNNNQNTGAASGDFMSASNTSMNRDGGYINIMKERFQRVQSALLKNRPNFVPISQQASIQSQQQSQQLSSITSSPISDNTIKLQNNEESLVTQLQSQQLMRYNRSKHSDCTLEIEKYLSRCKIIYDRDCLNQYKALKFRDTINASQSSNYVCLSSSMNKWKPKGYLVSNSNEHTKEISKLSRNFDSSFFSTCSTVESCVKIWSIDSLLDAKSGFFKSIYTFDRQNNHNNTHGSNSPTSNPTPASIVNAYAVQDTLFRPCCTSFYNRNSLAILCEDYRFYGIDFDANRNNYRIFSNDKLFKSNQCKNVICNCSTNSTVSYPRTNFYYASRNLAKKPHQVINSCSCSLNYPIEMIHIDDQNPSINASNANLTDYYYSGSRSSNVKGLFCYSTSFGDLSCIDMRSFSKAFDLKRDLRQGYVTSMLSDPWHTWLACGTSTGQIEVYDFRFMLPVQTFEHRSRTAVVKLANHPYLNSRIVAAYQANNEIAIWNIDSSKHSVNQRPRPDLVYWGVQNVPPLCQNKISNFYISGLTSIAAFGDEQSTNGLICASTDMKIRYIDLNEPFKESYIVSSAFNFQQNGNIASNQSSGLTSLNSNNKSEFASSLLSQPVSFETRQIEGTRVLLELDPNNAQNNGSSQANCSGSATSSNTYSMPALTHQSYFTHHQDAITDLVVCYNHNSYSNTNSSNNTPKNMPLIITSSRDGCLKIWK